MSHEQVKSDIEQALWLEFINDVELESDNHMDQLGQFWMWYQEKKSNYKPPKVVEKVVYRSNGDYPRSGNYIIKGV